MDPSNDEQTELLRAIWKQMVAMDRNLSSRIDLTNERLERMYKELSGRIDQTNARLDQTNARLDQTSSRLDRLIEICKDNFARIGRNFERVYARLEDLATREIAQLDSRLTRVEAHLGLRSGE